MIYIENLIIGAGISGLSNAFFLKRNNRDFLILDSQNKAGGKIRGQYIDGYRLEYGPNTVLYNNDPFRDIVKHLQLEKDLVYSNPQVKNRFILKKNVIHKIPTSLFSFLSSKLLTFKGKISIFKDLFSKKNNHDMPVEDFIKSRFGSQIHDNLIEPFLTGVYASDTSKLSSKYSLKKLWQFQKESSSIIFGLLKKRNVQKSPIVYFKEGFGYFINKLVDFVKENLLLSCKVSRIEKNNDFLIVDTECGKKIKCKKLFISTESNQISKMIFDVSLKEALQKIKYNSIDVIHLGFEKEKAKFNFNGFGLLSRKKDNRNFLGVLFNSQIFSNICSKENELITVLVGGQNNPTIVKESPDEVLNTIKNDMKNLFKISEFNFEKHFRWREAIPLYSINHDLVNKEIEKFNINNPNIFINSNFLDGVSVSDCILKSYESVEKSLKIS